MIFGFCQTNASNWFPFRIEFEIVYFLETLAAEPTILLECKHAFHHGCVKKMLEMRWNGPRIQFGFRGCPLCKRYETYMNKLKKKQ